VKFAQFAFIIIFSVLAAVMTSWSLSHMHAGTTAPVAAETSYQRVLRTGTLRCGYQYWDSAVMRDEKTGQLHGAWVEIMDAIGHATGLKIEWASQVGWDDVGAALKSGKIDAMCAGMWTSAAKAKEIAFTTPLAYQGIEAFVRTDNHKFDSGGLDAINDPNVTVAVIDNDNSDFIALQDYPKAKKISLGTLTGTDSDLMMNVLTGKADVTFTVTGLWRQFEKTNAGQIRQLVPGHKLRVFGLSIAVDNDDPRLLSLLNAGVQETQNSGFLDRILDKASADFPDMYIKPLKPFP
jgi:ABC-type amino acid transport substrate-binding protein